MPHRLHRFWGGKSGRVRPSAPFLIKQVGNVVLRGLYLFFVAIEFRHGEVGLYLKIRLRGRGYAMGAR